MDLDRLKSLTERKLHERVPLHMSLHFVGRADDAVQEAETALGTVKRELKGHGKSDHVVGKALDAAIKAVGAARAKTQALESAVSNAKL